MFRAGEGAFAGNGCVQECEGDGDGDNVMESGSMSFNYYDGIECSHITATTSPVHCCL